MYSTSVQPIMMHLGTSQYEFFPKQNKLTSISNQSIKCFIKYLYQYLLLIKNKNININKQNKTIGIPSKYEFNTSESKYYVSIF